MRRSLLALVLTAPLLAQQTIYTFRGAQGGTQLGAVLDLADVNGDGHADLILGLPTAAGTNGPWSGRVVVRSGRHGGILFEATGLATGDRFGSAVSDAGDTDGDGLRDVAVGAPFDDRAGADAGSVTILSGRDGSVLRTLLGALPGLNFGSAVDGGLDASGDGRPDIVVGAPLANFNGTQSGSVYLFSGANGAQLARFDGSGASDFFGFAAALLGDLDGDLRSEVGGGAPQSFTTKIGYVRVHASGSGAVLHRWNGDGAPDQLGWALASAGDADNDGVADVIACLYGRSTAVGAILGGVRVWSGRTGTVLHTLEGSRSFERFGMTLAAAGDIDGDGHDDFAVGAESAGFVKFFSGRLGTELRQVTGAGTFGSQLAGGSDVNGDRRADVLVGARWDATNGTLSGAAHVISSVPLTLHANDHRVSLAGGGSVTLSLAAGPAFAGRIYVLIGSLSGIAPGINLGTVTLPLNFDSYMLSTLNNPNRLPLTNSVGVLDGNGAAVAAFGLPAGFSLIAPSAVFDHAFLLVPAPTFDFASNAVVIRIDQ